MEEEKYQKELFEFEKPKRLLPRFSVFFPKADFERNVILTLTLDRAVFIAIGIIMIMVVVYALGVETGKARPTADNQQTAALAHAPAAQPADVTTQQAVREGRQSAQIQPVAAVKASPAPVNTTASGAKKAPALDFADKPYVIVAATFTQKDNAMQEVRKLRQQGFDAMLLHGGRYFQACVGAYTDKSGQQSQKDLKKVKKLYKDAYLRLR